MLADALLEVGEQQKVVLTQLQWWNVSELRIQEVGMFVGIPIDLNPHLIAQEIEVPANSAHANLKVLGKFSGRNLFLVLNDGHDLP